MLRINHRKLVTYICLFMFMCTMVLGTMPTGAMAEDNEPPAGEPLTITTTSLADATAGTAYSQTIITFGGLAPLTFTLTENSSLPNGLELDANTGEISGTPAQAGDYSFTIEVTDAASVPQSASQSYNLKVDSAPLPILNTTPLPVQSDYQDDFVMTIHENPNQDLWSNTAENLNLKIYSFTYGPAGGDEELVAEISSDNITIGTDAAAGVNNIQFTLPGGLQPDAYKIVILKGLIPIAVSNIFIETKYFEVHPEHLFSAWGKDFVINLDEAQENVWTRDEDNLSAQINKIVYDCDGKHLHPVGSRIALPADRVNEVNIQLSLPISLEPGSYIIEMFRSEKLIGRSQLFEVHVFNVGINPDVLMDDYPANQQITLLDPDNLDLWNENSILVVDVLKIADCVGGVILPPGTNGSGSGGGAGMHREETLIASVSPAELTVTDDNIVFTLPSGLVKGEYRIRIKEEQNSDQIVLGEATLGIFQACTRLDMNPHQISVGRITPATLYEPVNESSLWNGGDALQFQLFRHIPQTPWAPTNFDFFPADFGTVVVSKDQINLTLPPTLIPGQYLLAVNKGGDRIAYANFQVNPPLVNLLANPANILIGYKGQKLIHLSNPNGSCPWNPQDRVGIRLLQMEANSNNFIDWGEIPAQGVTPSGIDAMLPEGLQEGNYVLSINQYEVEVAFAWLSIQTLPLNAAPHSFPAANPQPREIFLNALPNMPVTWSARDILSYRLYKHNPHVTPAIFEDTGICGAIEQLAGYTLRLQLPAGMEKGFYEIAIENNGSKIAFANFEVMPGSSQVVAGVCAGFKSSKVKIPVFGVYTQGAAGVQFQLNFDPQWLSVVGTPGTDVWNIETYLPGSFSVDNEKGTINFALAVEDGMSIGEDIIKFCEVEFAISQEADGFLPIGLNALDDSLLSDGYNEIPAQAMPGGIYLVELGDVNENGRIDVGDAILILRHYAGINTLSADRQKIGDVDGVEGITLEDAICILERVVHKINKFPVEMQ